jgi:hypothetical protein
LVDKNLTVLGLSTEPDRNIAHDADQPPARSSDAGGTSDVVSADTECSKSTWKLFPVLLYRSGGITPVLGITSPKIDTEIGWRFPADPPQRHRGTLVVGPASQFVQRVPGDAAFYAGLPDLWWLIGHPGRNQHTR